MIRAVNKFKADFGGQVVSLERVQPSLDHVPHRFAILNLIESSQIITFCCLLFLWFFLLMAHLPLFILVILR